MDRSNRRHERIKEIAAQSMANMVPSVSVIVPTYNSAKTLDDCLESIKNQDYKGEVEIIIADGGSTDNTLEIVRKYTEKIYPNHLETGEASKVIKAENLIEIFII